MTVKVAWAAPGAVGALRAAYLAAVAVVISLVALAQPSAATIYHYDAAAYVYDGPALLSSPDTVATDARGSPSRPGAASWVSPVSAACDVVAANTVDNVLPTPQVSSARLQNLVDNLYKGTTNPNRVGTGTTMDAIRSEMATGVPTAGRMHTVKGQETLQGLNNRLRRNPDAPYQDRLVAQSLADELARVLGGGS
ncbi:hypothetical protein [Cellulomonas bogoriensis]|nr:hypothetical protein [Cellulomonas bogoriensis]